MAKYDHGGGCPCGLYKECTPDCKEEKSMREEAWRAYEKTYRKLKEQRKKDAPD